MEKQLFTIGSFSVLLWHVLLVVALLLIIAAVVLIAVFSRKKSAKQQSTQTVAEEPAPVQEQPAEEAEPAPQPVEDTQPAEQPAASDSQPAEEDQTNVVVSEEDYDEPDEEPATEEEAADQEKAAEERKRPKNYHISLRSDGKWQVKLQKGAKPLKLFNTQAEAIAFAKEKARNQEGSITIHKVNGQIRKQKY